MPDPFRRAYRSDYIKLTTENGVAVTNVLYLEPAVITALLRELGTDFDRGKLCQALGVQIDEELDGE